jgi:AraC-like DNA-binding protein
MLLQGARARSINPEPILFRHGISRISLDSPTYRVPLPSFAAFVIDLMEAEGDELLGLGAQPQPLGSYNMMCRACISAKTIKRSLQRCANFWNLFRNTFEHRTLISGGRVYYELHPIAGQESLNNYAIETLLSTIHRFHCWLGGQFIPLLSVSLSFPEPEYSEAYKQLFYGAPMRFEQAQPALQFEARYANLDIVQTSETLDTYLAGRNLSLLNQPKQYRAISDQVRRWLEKSIRRGNYTATLKQAAAHFQLSQQVMHRRLQAESTSFKELKMQTRRDISINLLFSDKFKIEEIATRVGFSEPSAFIRAFKSWTGATPLQYRQQNR